MEREYTPSLATRVFGYTLALATVVAVIVAAVSAAIFKSSLAEDAQGKLAEECAIVASLLDGDDGPVAQLEDLDMGAVRLTLIAPDGTVLYDSMEPAEALANHATREEVAQAMETGEGSSERASETVGTISYYHALRLDSGNVVRLAEERSLANSMLWSRTWVLGLIVAAIVLMSWGVARLVSKRLVEPILSIDPGTPGASAPYRELEPLVERLDEQQTALKEQMRQLENTAIMRQTFTANVTHELKTPLASISGAAELMRDGFVPLEDTGAFAGRIYDSAHQLTTLVNDILTLSRLDESERAGNEGLLDNVEPCDLHTIAADAASRLATIAEDAEVTIAVEGTSTVIEGRARLLGELVGNLCNNAIRYNKPGGNVRMWVGVEEGSPTVRVTDTGIGIAEEDLPKVFERFYRADVSRSRERGGTGLGLAIAKHVATLHGATIEATSELGRGTTMCVRFPTSALVNVGGGVEDHG